MITSSTGAIDKPIDLAYTHYIHVHPTSSAIMLLTLRASSSRVAPVLDAVRYMATATVQGSKFAKTTGNPGKQSAESALASMLELRASVPVEKSATAAAAAKRKTAMEALPSEIMATIHLAKVPGRLSPGKKPLGPTGELGSARVIAWCHNAGRMREGCGA